MIQKGGMMDKHTEKPVWRRRLEEAGGLLAGTLSLAVAIAFFLVPARLAPGGVTGIASILFNSLGFPLSYSYILFNIPLFLLAFWLLGGKFGLKSVIMTLFLSAILLVLEWLQEPINEILGLDLSQDPLLGAIFGGVLAGFGIGLLLRFGASTGGTDLLAKLIHKWFPLMSLGRWLLLLDAMVLVGGMVVFANASLGLYSLISLFVTMQAVDWTVEGVDFAKEALVITSHPGQIKEAIFSRLDRGVTFWKAEGGYTGEERTVLYCVLRPRELPVLRKLVMEIDPQAFVVVHDAREVLGMGFNQRGKVL
jgi:uncharacterized membrane-anchored protein YitT (DUF2179 family)